MCPEASKGILSVLAEFQGRRFTPPALFIAVAIRVLASPGAIEEFPDR